MSPALDCCSISECADARPKRGREVSSNCAAEPTERSEQSRARALRRAWRVPHRSSMRRVPILAVFHGLSMRRLLVGMIMKIVQGQFASRTTAPSSQCQSSAQKCNEPEEPADDHQARLHYVAARL